MTHLRAACLGRSGEGSGITPGGDWGVAVPGTLLNNQQNKTMTTETEIESPSNLINGKHYPMWQGIVNGKERYIGGKLVEHDNHTGDAETEITDLRLAPNGESSAMICVDGKDWGAKCDVEYCGISGEGGNLVIQTRFGTSWTLIAKP